MVKNQLSNELFAIIPEKIPTSKQQKTEITVFLRLVRFKGLIVNQLVFANK